MSDDDIYESSANQALQVASKAEVDRTGRLAEEAGLQAVQQQASPDSPLNGGKSFSGGTGNAPGDVQAREFEANREAQQARRAIMESGGLSMDDLLDLSVSDGGTGAQSAMQMKRKMSAVAGHMVDSGARGVVQSAYMDPNEASMLMEQEAYSPQQSAEGWQVRKTAATLKSGKQIPVFVVEDSVSGMTTGKKYRLSQVAEKVARVINTTGNPNDSRIRMLNETYDKHVQLMRERADAKKSGNRKRVQMVESKLEEINAKLGIG